jgi:hypothetical protein
MRAPTGGARKSAAGPGLAGNTLRQSLLATLAGNRARLLFSNEWGEAPVTFECVRLANAKGASSIETSTQRALSFGGSPAVTIPPGQTRASDPLDFPVAVLGSLALSIHFGAVPRELTGHPSSRTTVYLVRGNAASAASLPDAVTTEHWYFIVGLEVEASAPAAALVTLGDSITGGRESTTNANNRWPDNLARRLRSKCPCPEPENAATTLAAPLVRDGWVELMVTSSVAFRRSLRRLIAITRAAEGYVRLGCAA